MKVSFEDVQRYLKLSKSGKVNNEPYTLEFDTAWWNIFDRNGVLVGQKPEPVSPSSEQEIGLTVKKSEE